MSSASQPVLPVSPPTEHWTELSIVDRILRAADWPELKRWAEVALGPSSFELGVCCGIVENIAGSVIGVLDLLKTFILAGLYTQARQSPAWWDVVGLSEHWIGKGAELVLGAELKKAHDLCEALMREVMYAVKHPREFLKTTKDNYLRQYAQKWELFQRLVVQTDLTSKFRAGEIFGEVLLDVLMLVILAAGAAEAAAKLAGEVPELVKLAENLKGVLKVKPGATRLGGAAAVAEDAEAAEVPMNQKNRFPEATVEAEGRGFSSEAQLDGHYEKHGSEFGNISKQEYLRRAQELRDAPLGDPIVEAKRPGGQFSRFDRSTGYFGAYNPDGTIRTFFIPNAGEGYFLRQAGR